MTSNNTLKDVYLNRVSAFLPNAPVGNDEMEAVLGMAGDVPSRVRRMILRSNGILSRHYAIDPESRRTTHTNAELAAEAVNGLFAQGVSAETIGSLACATSYPDQTMPGHGVMVHGLLDMPPCEVFSMAGVCAAGMAAMKHAYNAVRTGEHAHAVSVASENASAVMRGEVFQSETDHKKLENASPEIGFEKDFLRWMLSDGAGAVYLSDRPNSDGLSLKIHWIDLLSYANEMPPCMYAGAEFRDGSSGFFRDRLSDGLKNIGFDIPQEKWFTNLHSKGNTGSASIYIILEEFLRTFPIEHGQKILCYVPESGRFSTCFMLLEVVKAV